MSLRDLAHLKFNSSLLRGVLRRFYRDGDICTIRLGPLRGRRLIYRPAVNFHAILGLWDLEVFQFLHSMVFDKKLLGPQSIVADVGANLGFYSLWFAGRVNQVHAFEPAPEARAMLMENLAVNGTRNVSIVASACGDRQGAIDFFVADHHHRSSFDESWAGDRATKISIPVTSLDQYFADLGNNWPDFIKMDIEGGGTSALPGAARCLREKRPLLLIESHTPQEDGAISDVLRTYDYAAYRFETKAWVQNRETTHPDPLGVWGTMFLCPSEKKHHFMHK